MRRHVGPQRVMARQSLSKVDGEVDRKKCAALDASHGRQPRVVSDVGGLAGPRREGAEARDDQECRAAGSGSGRFTVRQQRLESGAIALIERPAGMDEVNETGAERVSRSLNRSDRCQQPRRTKSRQRTRPVEREERTGLGHLTMAHEDRVRSSLAGLTSARNYSGAFATTASCAEA